MKPETVSYLPITDKNRFAQHNMNPDLATQSHNISISGPQDIVSARQQGRILTQELGCSSTQATLVATAISELARNIILYADHGEIILQRIENDTKFGLQIVAIDEGPGIPNIARAMMNGFSTSGGLGLGLPGLKHIADSFDIDSKPGQGVRVAMRMWLVEK